MSMRTYSRCTYQGHIPRKYGTFSLISIHLTYSALVFSVVTENLNGEPLKQWKHIHTHRCIKVLTQCHGTEHNTHTYNTVREKTTHEQNTHRRQTANTHQNRWQTAHQQNIHTHKHTVYSTYEEKIRRKPLTSICAWENCEVCRTPTTSICARLTVTAIRWVFGDACVQHTMFWCKNNGELKITG